MRIADDMTAQPLLVEGLSVFDASGARLDVIFQYSVEGKYIRTPRDKAPARTSVAAKAGASDVVAPSSRVAKSAFRKRFSGSKDGDRAAAV